MSMINTWIAETDRDYYPVGFYFFVDADFLNDVVCFGPFETADDAIRNRNKFLADVSSNYKDTNVVLKSTVGRGLERS